MNTFCTIITADYFPYAISLYKSLRTQDPTVSLWVLVADNEPIEDTARWPGIRAITASSLENNPGLREMHQKYAYTNMDFFRWAAKPAFIVYLLETGYEKVLFADCDLFFFNQYDFLFGELDRSSILLTPHWGSVDPEIEEDTFFKYFTNGIFNAGFIGASSNGLPAMRWWAKVCHYKMGELRELGIYDDQKYLDILPVKYENIHIIRHKGCNILSLKNEKMSGPAGTNKLLIDNVYPVIFVHFTSSTLKNILKAEDPHLVPYYNEFKKTFEEDGRSLAGHTQRLKIPLNTTLPMKIKWRLRIRTRIKRFFFKLAQSM